MFELTKSQREIQKAAAQFAQGTFDKALCHELDRSRQFPDQLWRTAGDLGFIGMHYPEKYHGQSLGLLDTLLVFETLCRRDVTLGSALALSGFAADCILKFADEAIKEKYIPLIAECRILCGAAPVTRNFDPGALTAAPVDDGWCINGSAYRVINGGLAGCYCLLCQTDATAPPDKSMSMFLVAADRQGLSVESMVEPLGLRTIPLSALRLDNVRIPGDHLLGKPGAGLQHYQTFADINRLIYAAMALGAAQAARDRALKYTKQREVFGQKIACFQVSEHKIADMAIKIEQAKCLLYQAAAAFDRGQINSEYIAMAKLSSCRAAVEVSGEAMQLLGGYGYTSEYEVERFYRDAKTMEIFPDAPLTLKDGIAKAMIGRIRK